MSVRDRLRSIVVPPDNRLPQIAQSIEFAMTEGVTTDVRRTCDEFLSTAADFYKVPRCEIRVLNARPRRVREYSTTELFGDYQPATLQIRVWMRTAIRKDVTSFGTFLSTLCHEFNHHLDFHGHFSLALLIRISSLIRHSCFVIRAFPPPSFRPPQLRKKLYHFAIRFFLLLVGWIANLL